MILRSVCLAGVFAATVVPLLSPMAAAITTADAWTVGQEAPRISGLIENTLGLVGLTTLFVASPSLVLAIYLAATDLPFRHWAAVALIAALGIPLPIFAVAWQCRAISIWSPFSQGIVAAAAIHALAALPWVTLIIAIGLSQTDHAADENARTYAGPLIRFLAIRLPSCWPFIAAAIFWVAIQCCNEIVVTDVMQVRTFGEEIYTQFVSPAVVSGGSAELALARAVLATMPAVLAMTLLMGFVCLSGKWTMLIEHRDNAVDPKTRSHRWLIGAAGLGLAMVPIALPALALFIRSGIVLRSAWSFSEFAARIWYAIHFNSLSLMESLVISIVTACLLTAIAASCCWMARRNSLVRFFLVITAILAAAMPAPILGLGVKSCIDSLLDVERRFLGTAILQRWLYEGPSYLPVMWAWFIRGLPLTVVILWPSIRRLSDDFGETTKLSTSSTWQFTIWDLIPTSGGAMLIAIGLGSLFSFGEVGASRIVATPGAATFANDVFAQMHFGVTPELAATCVTLLFTVIASTAIILLLREHVRRRRHAHCGQQPQ